MQTAIKVGEICDKTTVKIHSFIKFYYNFTHIGVLPLLAQLSTGKKNNSSYIVTRVYSQSGLATSSCLAEIGTASQHRRRDKSDIPSVRCERAILNM